jgi:uncharacterized protein (TIGR03118 family)
MRSWTLRRPPSRRRPSDPARACRLRLEALDPRCLPSATVFLQTNLVSDQSGAARLTDPNLVNGWGIALSPTAGAFWVSSNGADKSVLFTGDVNGSPLAVSPLVVSIPGGAPTGAVFNGTADFVVKNGTASGPALFIFASENGNITGWNPNVPPPPPSTNAQPAASVSGAVFKGLALASSGGNNFLYAANFHDNKVVVFDKNFQVTTLAGSFTDPMLPAGFAPFNVASLNGKLYVSYAKQDAAMHDDVAGPGNGFIDVFDTSGNFQQRLVSNGPLNSPWGMVIAPSSFGEFAGDLLVGNFGDGHISAFDPNTGASLGQLMTGGGQPLVIDGLWGLAFGNGVTAGDKNTLYFSAGPGGEMHGLFGSLKAVTPLTAVGQGEGGAPLVKVFNSADNTLRFSFDAFEGAFTGGVRVATGDLNGDGIPDIIAAAGPGGGPAVKVFDGKTGGLIRAFFAYDQAFTGGVYVATGDVNGDGTPDIITGAGPGGGPNVKVFNGKDGTLLTSFFAFDQAFTGGVTVASGDFNADGQADVIAGAGPGGGPEVAVFSGKDNSVLKAFFAYDQAFTGGVFVAAGDFNGDGKPDIFTGAGPGGGPHVKVFDGTNGTLLTSFFAYGPTFTGGVRVAATDVNADGSADVVTGAGPSGGPAVTVVSGPSDKVLNAFFAFDPTFLGGVYVG